MRKTVAAMSTVLVLAVPLAAVADEVVFPPGVKAPVEDDSNLVKRFDVPTTTTVAPEVVEVPAPFFSAGVRII